MFDKCMPGISGYRRGCASGMHTIDLTQHFRANEYTQTYYLKLREHEYDSR